MRSGDRVALRSPEEILATLDDTGCLAGMPFMPEMLRFFGRSFVVDGQVRRACDTVNYTGVRELRDTVLLDDLRCDGSAHAQCGAQCRIYWNEAWLRPAGENATVNEAALRHLERFVGERVHARDSTRHVPTFRCQATELLRSSELVPGWSARSFLRELTSGNVGPGRFLGVATRIVVEKIGRRLKLLSNNPFRPSEVGGSSYVATEPQRFAPGELVQIRTKCEIGETLGENGKNRGLWFDREMVPYCGHTARVKAKVERFIDESGRPMVELASDCYILDGVVCKSYQSVNVGSARARSTRGGGSPG